MNDPTDESELEIGGLQIQPGARIGPFVYRRLIGKGGMANVVLASAPDGEQVALKILKSSRMGTGLARFKREFKALARLRHPNVIRVDAYGDIHGHPYIAMEHVEGTDLHHVIHSFKEAPYKTDLALRWQRCTELLIDLCRALAYIHRRGLVHRDLKPSNVLITTQNVCKLTDFGIVKDLDKAWADPMVSTTLVGTWAYASPEQIAGQPIDHRSDLYSLGVILFAMLTGKRPFVAKDLAGYLELHRTHRAPAPSELDPNIPPVLDEICQRLLRKLPRERYRSAEEILYRLESLPAPRVVETGLLPLGGRARELALLQDKVAALTSSQGGIVLIEGSEGIGKSRILREVQRAAEAIGIPIHHSVFSQSNPMPELTIPEAGPAVVLLEDIEFAASSTFPLIGDLVRKARATTQGLLLVATVLKDNRGRLRGMLEAHAELISLLQLQEPEVEALCAELIGTSRGAVELGRRLFWETAGWPAHLNAYIRALTAQGMLVASGASFRLVADLEDISLGHIEIPAEIRSLVHRHTARLSEEDMGIAAVIAVGGHRVELDTVLEVLGLDEDLASASLGRIQRVGLVRGATTGWLEWVHPKFRDVIYQELDEDHRATLHRQLAEVLGRRFKDVPAAAAVIGDHFRLAGEAGKAYQRLCDAVTRALARGHADEAVDLVEKAVSVEDQARVDLVPSEFIFLKRQLLEQQAEACQIRGEWAEARDLLEQALGVERVLDEASRLRLQLQLARALMRLQQLPRATKLAYEVLNGARERHDRELVVEALRVLANLAWTQGDLDGCEAQAHEGLLLATTASQTRAALLVALTSVQANRGQLALAVNGLQEARSILKELGLKPACAVVLANLAEVQLGLGELQAAWERAAEALAVAGECGHKMAESAAHRVRGMILATVGVHQEAQVELVVALELARELKANHEICGSAFFLARIAVEEGQFEEAEKWIQTGMALVAAGDPERYGAALSVEQALVLALNGKQQEAIALLIKDVPDRLPALRRAEVLLDMARCHAALGISERALALAREAQGLARLRNFQGLMPEILAFISWFSTNIREKEAAMRELSESFAAISGSLPTSWVISLKNRLGLQ